MSTSPIEVGMYVVAKAPLAGVEALAGAAQDQQLDSIFIWDHLQDFFPSAIWDEEFTWAAAGSASPHEWFEFQTLLGYLAAKFPAMRLGVGVTEPINPASAKAVTGSPFSPASARRASGSCVLRSRLACRAGSSRWRACG